MQIVAYRLYETVVNCRRPFKIATGVQEACKTLIVELTMENGVRAYGEAVPIPLLTDESLAGCRQLLVDELLPLLRNRSIWAIRDIHKDMLCRTRAKSARCAIDLALHYAQAKCAGVHLAKLLGTSSTSFPTNYSIGIEELETSVFLASQIVDRGYDRIKLKVGVGVEADVATVKRVSEVLPDGVKLRLDANCGWDRVQAVEALTAMQDSACPIELVEQPVAREDFAGLKYVRERVSYLIAADESVQNIHDAKRLLQDECVDILNLKLMKAGGILPALEIAALARAYGCRLMIGGMVGESIIGVQAAASIAAALGFEYADLDADILLKDTPFAGLEPGDAPFTALPPYRSWQDAKSYELELNQSNKLVDCWT